jgi:hypothetical protein
MARVRQHDERCNPVRGGAFDGIGTFLVQLTRVRSGQKKSARDAG